MLVVVVVVVVADGHAMPIQEMVLVLVIDGVIMQQVVFVVQHLVCVQIPQIVNVLVLAILDLFPPIHMLLPVLDRQYAKDMLGALV
jgi:hypothetical protein